MELESSPGGMDGGNTSDGPMTMTGFIAARDDQVVIVLQTTVGSATPGLDEAALQVIVSDPTVGLSTTADLNAAGEALQDFQRGGLTQTGSASSSEVEVTQAPPSSPASRQPR